MWAHTVRLSELDYILEYRFFEASHTVLNNVTSRLRWEASYYTGTVSVIDNYGAVRRPQDHVVQLSSLMLL